MGFNDELCPANEGKRTEQSGRLWWTKPSFNICATVGLADVTSANIVGYETSALADGKLNMQGVNFIGVSGEDINLNTISFAELTAGNDDTDADSVLVWSATDNGYTTFYYDKYDSCWYDAYTSEEPDFPVGTAFWFKAFKSGAAKAKGMSISGAVEQDIVDPFTIFDGKLNMFVNPYPVAIDLNDKNTVVFTGLTAGNDDTDADSVLVWSAADNGYTTFYYDKYDSCWYDAYTSEEPQFAAGTAFWFKAYKPGTAQTKTIQFVSPFEKK